MEKHSSNIFLKSIQTLFKRFHLLIFFVFIIACLSVVVILVNEILTGETVDTTYIPPTSARAIDQATLDQLQSLHTSSGVPTPEVPDGRINPFSE